LLFIYEDSRACAFSKELVGEGKVVKELLTSFGPDKQTHGVLARAPDQSVQAAIDKNATDVDQDEKTLHE